MICEEMHSIFNELKIQIIDQNVEPAVNRQPGLPGTREVEPAFHALPLQDLHANTFEWSFRFF